MSGGWIKFWRKAIDHPLYPRRREFTEFEAWLDLLLRANHQPARRHVAGKPIVVDRGELVEPVAALAERWQWPEARARRFIARLKREDMVETEAVGRRTTRIRIIRWEHYQGRADGEPVTDSTSDESGSYDDARRTTDGPATNQPTDQQGYILQEGKKGRTLSAAKRRKPDPVWDAVVGAFKLNPVTDRDRKRVGGIVRDLKAKGAEPDDIPRCIARYRDAWPEAACTPEAILKHWDQFATDNGHAPAATPGDVFQGIQAGRVREAVVDRHVIDLTLADGYSEQGIKRNGTLLLPTTDLERATFR